MRRELRKDVREDLEREVRDGRRAAGDEGREEELVSDLATRISCCEAERKGTHPKPSFALPLRSRLEGDGPPGPGADEPDSSPPPELRMPFRLAASPFERAIDEVMAVLVELDDEVWRARSRTMTVGGSGRGTRATSASCG